MVFSAFILSDRNNPAPFCHAKLLNLTEQSKSFFIVIVKFIRFVPNSNVLTL